MARTKIKVNKNSLKDKVEDIIKKDLIELRELLIYHAYFLNRSYWFSLYKNHDVDIDDYYEYRNKAGEILNKQKKIRELLV